MDTSTARPATLPEATARLTRRLMTIGENRLELLSVEVQEERERLLHTVLLGLAAAAFGLLSAMALTAAIVVLLWNVAPVTALLFLAVLYGAGGLLTGRRLMAGLQGRQGFSASLEQLRKDREALEKFLE